MEEKRSAEEVREELAKLVGGHNDNGWNPYCLGWFYALKWFLGETELDE